MSKTWVAFLIISLVLIPFTFISLSIPSNLSENTAEFIFLPLVSNGIPLDGVEVRFEFSEVVISQDDPRELAVAFSAIRYIDSQGKTISDLDMGTSEANQLQADGWYENQTLPDIGPYQWAGTDNKQASIRLSIPVGTEGLLLEINSIKDNLWMKVVIDGEQAANLRVDAYWHLGYVPVGSAVPEVQPTTEPKWIEDQYFPHFPATDRIYVFPVPTDLDQYFATDPTWRISQSYKTMMTLTIVGMQGIINRNKPRIYLDYENNISDSSRFWVTYLEDHVEVVDLDLDYLSIINFLIRRYGSRFSGAVIYDPEVPDTINLATMIAGLEDRMILAPEQLDLPGIPDFESVVDLRTLVLEKGWDNSEESRYSIYEWVYDNLWPNLEHRILGVISPGPPTSGEYIPGHFNPLGMAQRDYYIALKLSALYLDPGHSQQAELYSRFLEDAPELIPVTGVTPLETTSVPLISQYGDWNATLSYPNGPLQAFNLTVFSGVRPDPLPYQPQINPDRILATLGTSPVAMMFSSDGDNLSMQMDLGFPGGPDWVWQKVQGYRFGWTMNPTLTNLAPVIWNYYVTSRDEAEFVCGISGAGATLIDYMSDAQLQAYLERTEVYLEQTGMRSIHVHLDKIARLTDEIAGYYYDGLVDSDYLGMVAGPGVTRGLGFTYAGRPSAAPQIAYGLEPSTNDAVIQDIFSRDTDNIVFEFGSYPDHNGVIVTDPDAGSGQAALFSNSSTEYVEVMSGPLINLAPGDYTATFRLKVSDNSSPENFFRFDIGHMTFSGVNVVNSGWEQITLKEISPDDFIESDQYQLIQIPFTLEKLTPYIEIIIGHRGSYADLTADYFSITKDEPDNFPVFAVLFIPTLSAERLTDVPKQFTEDFESAGGILLTPDEFMAALNPEYMIEFAEPYLGSGHPAIVEANQQLSDGYYMKSLLTIREALSDVIE